MLLADKAVYAKYLNADRPITSGEATKWTVNEFWTDGNKKRADRAVMSEAHSGGSWATSNSNTKKKKICNGFYGFRLLLQKVSRVKVEENRRQSPMK